MTHIPISQIALHVPPSHAMVIVHEMGIVPSVATISHFGFPWSLARVILPPLSMDVWLNFIPLFSRKHGDLGSRKLHLILKNMEKVIIKKHSSCSCKIFVQLKNATPFFESMEFNNIKGTTRGPTDKVLYAVIKLFHCYKHLC